MTTPVTEIELPGIGEPETLVVRRRTLPDPAAGQAVVAMEATGVSFAEQQMRLGKYYDQPPFPFVPGYDVVGTVTALGPGESPVEVGQRVAALTKVGGWADHLLLPAADLVPVPDDVDPRDAETLVVNGLTAQKMLFRSAKVRRGQTIVVLGASGGVGSTLVQLARLAGITVIGVAGSAQQERVAELGATPVDYRSDDVAARIRELAPGGVDAVFDHVGGPGIVDSWRMLARGGTLVSYGTASTKDAAGNSRLPVLKLIARLTWWNLAPNGRRASFFNVWAGARLHPGRFRARLHGDLTHVLRLLSAGSITAQVAAVYPLSQAAAALREAESGGVRGKIVLVPDDAPAVTADGA